MFTTIRSTALAAASLALLAGGAIVAAPADAAIPEDDTPTLSAVRQNTIDRARAALNNPRKFKLANSETVHQSTVVSSPHVNRLEVNGSNANRNEFNDYNGKEWCGYFAAAMWTGQNTPAASAFPRIPTYYESSQAWRTDVGNRFHPFTGAGGAKPAPGDVLVWQNLDTSTGGHVGIVISFNYDTNQVVTIQGNVNGDEIARVVYTWNRASLDISGKTFKGFTDRE